VGRPQSVKPALGSCDRPSGEFDQPHLLATGSGPDDCQHRCAVGARPLRLDRDHCVSTAIAALACSALGVCETPHPSLPRLRRDVQQATLLRRTLCTGRLCSDPLI
jgi:hypothetical protein